MRNLIAGLMGLFWVALGAPAAGQQSGQITVFAAASLSSALTEINELFTQRTGIRVRTSFAASSTLAKQIENGAEAHVFISADEAWMNYLETQKRTVPHTRRALLGNELVLIVPSSDQKIYAATDLKAWLHALPSGRIATGDPAHVPVGKYARQAFEKLGLWPDLEKRLAAADNVRSALVLVERGEAVAGIVYRTDAIGSKSVRIIGEVPESARDPIIYPVALLNGDGATSPKTYYEFLSSAAARKVFSRYGFSPM